MHINCPLTITGRSAFGFDSQLIISPVDRQGVYWKISGELVPLNKVLLTSNPLLHYLVLRYENKVLRVPEHFLGFITAIGLNNVCIELPCFNFPYDGAAQIFWNSFQSSLFSGKPLDLYTPDEQIEITFKDGRREQFIPNKKAITLEYDITVCYQQIGSYTFKGFLNELNIAELVASRPCGRSGLHKTVSGIFNRSEQYAWLNPLDNEESKTAAFAEIARHRLLDLLGALACVCPPGGTLAGKIISYPRTGHAVDVVLVKELKRVGLTRVICDER